MPRVSPSRKLGTLDSVVTRKPINILRTQDLKFEKMSRKDLLEILMSQPNSDVKKSIVVDVKSDTEEINETYNSLRKEELPLRKRIFL